MGVRHAFLWASFGRYIAMIVSLATTLILARLLAPQDYGAAVLGGALFAIAEALRAVGGGAYLIQKQDLSCDDIRACFTVSLAATLAVALALWCLAEPLARFFGVAHLDRYVAVAALGYFAGPCAYTIAALMSRALQFRALALIGVASALVNAAVSIGLAVHGCGYMSFAWGSACSTVVGALLYLYCWKDRSIFKPTLRQWRGVLGFGVYDSATALVSQVANNLPYFIFGKLLDAASVGLGQRAVTLCFVPERIILAGVGAVALPAFAQQARAGGDLRAAYLRATELITAAQWPSLLLLALLARPMTSALLGTQWLGVVPLVQILAIALLFSFPLALHYATLVAAGGIRRIPGVMALQSAASIALLAVATRHGLQTAMASTLVIVPCNALVSVSMARHYIAFRWLDLIAATRKSLLAAALAALGPAVLMMGFQTTDPPLAVTGSAVLLAAVGWLAGLKVTQHPLLDEIVRVALALRLGSTAMRVGQIGTRLFGR